jgi:hypothetical protein
MSPSKVLSFGLALCWLSVVASSQETREINKTLPLKPDGRIAIDTYKGSVTIGVWDKEEVEIHAKIEADDSWSSKQAEEDVQDTEIRISGSEQEVRIKTDYGRVRRNHDGFFGLFGTGTSLPLVHYAIKMPRTARLRIKDYKSETRIEDVRSDVEVNTYKGEVTISNCEGSLELETYKGRVAVTLSRLAGSSRIESYKGEITISLRKNTGFELETDFGRHTDFDSEFDVATRYRDRRGRIADYVGSVNGGGPRLFLKSEKGTFRLRQS